MPVTKKVKQEKLPSHFEDLVQLMPPRAIEADDEYDAMVEMIDRLMAIGKLTKGQAAYLETLVQLVQAYDAAQHAIDIGDISGLESLKHLMEENSMTAVDLARLLGVHSSMGSKILKGERSLTIEHVKKLASQFNVTPALFIR